MTVNALAFYAVAVLIVLAAAAAVGLPSLRLAGYAGAAVIVLLAVLELVSGAYALAVVQIVVPGVAAAVVILVLRRDAYRGLSALPHAPERFWIAAPGRHRHRRRARRDDRGRRIRLVSRDPSDSALSGPAPPRWSPCSTTGSPYALVIAWLVAVVSAAVGGLVIGRRSADEQTLDQLLQQRRQREELRAPTPRGSRAGAATACEERLVTIGVGQFAVLSAAVFAIGIYGVLARRHPLGVVMAIGLLFAAPIIALVGFTHAIPARPLAHRRRARRLRHRGRELPLQPRFRIDRAALAAHRTSGRRRARRPRGIGAVAIYNAAWAIPFLPLLGALASLGVETQRRAAQLCVVLQRPLVRDRGGRPRCSPDPRTGRTHSISLLTFFAMTPPEGAVFATQFQAQVGVQVDALSASFAAAITFATLVIQAYAVTCDARRARLPPVLLRHRRSLALLHHGFVLSPNLFDSLIMWVGCVGEPLRARCRCRGSAPISRITRCAPWWF